MTNAAPLGTVLSVWAHPDDETYLCGGLMAEAVRNGSRVVCITATRGELGSPDEERWPPGEPLAAVRTEEMAAALAALGVTEHHWLDYPDGGCTDVPDDEAVERITAVMTEVRPDTVLTFGPDGMTGHPDHISAGRWATAAFAAAAPEGARLAYATNTPEWLASFRAGLDAVGAFMGAEPPCTPESDLIIHRIFEGELLEAKLRAIRCQTSQVEPLVAVLGEDFLRDGMAEESFRAP
ncbi:MAG: N-acetyl-D-myo-inositol-2-amino-2-deoxy-alpha-D-glucopyranoside deacetylase [Actinomycetota bacterium]|nr:N-acetyl-D-myo-inositol-2-amino-2-deoxy-alpha-D-glucopyranoside deacetylase [Actinomycetota bacterium]